MPFTLKDLYYAYPGSDLLGCAPPDNISDEEFKQQVENGSGNTLFLFLVRELFGEPDLHINDMIERLFRAGDNVAAVCHAVIMKEREEAIDKNTKTANG